MKVLLLEDEINISNEIINYLTELNYEMYLATDGEKAEELLYNHKFDLLLLDFNVPKISGIEILTRYRHHGYRTPAIMITENATSELLEKCYKVGCDEFIKKPFCFKELVIRINYIRKIFKINANEIIKIDDTFSFDTLNLNILRANEVISLPNKESLIVKYFLNNQNRVISIDELLLDVWDYDSTPSIATIRTYIKNIRKKFDHQFIDTIKNRGYRFNAKLKTTC